MKVEKRNTRHGEILILLVFYIKQIIVMSVFSSQFENETHYIECNPFRLTSHFLARRNENEWENPTEIQFIKEKYD